MSSFPRKIAILGSTGSIGQSTVEVVQQSQGRLEVVGLAARRRLDVLCQQARLLHPRYVVAVDERAAAEFDWSPLPDGCELWTGAAGVERLARLPEVQTVVCAVVGNAGLAGTWAALEAGKTVALANKEALVMAGPLVMRLAAERGATILPVDSEHSAIFQALAAGSRKDVRRVILTASGGPFRLWSYEAMERASVAEALAHPTWQMGEKITIDSATMMNKALEMIEARWLFDLSAEQIEVVIHPQSIVHSLVEFVDGSVVAQLSPPDMKLPIQYALTWPQRLPSPARKLDWSQALRLEFEPPDVRRFPALALGREVAAAGGTAGAVLSAANEAAVERFLRGDLPLTQIVPACRAMVERHSFKADPTLDDLMAMDAWAREELKRWKQA